MEIVNFGFFLKNLPPHFCTRNICHTELRRHRIHLARDTRQHSPGIW